MNIDANVTKVLSHEFEPDEYEDNKRQRKRKKTKKVKHPRYKEMASLNDYDL